jgi:Tc toxin complex TcA C-terminal TcB-binding domain
MFSRPHLRFKHLFKHKDIFSKISGHDDIKWLLDTNQELYSWMLGQISAIYFQSYQLAYDLAKRAEVAFRLGLGLEKQTE